MSLFVSAKYSRPVSEVLEEPPTKKRRLESQVKTATKQLPSNIELITPELEKSINQLEYRIYHESARIAAKIAKSFSRCQAIETDICKYPDFAARFKALENAVSFRLPPAFTYKACCEAIKVDVQVGIAQTIGRRKAMEDTVLVTTCAFQAKGKGQTGLIMAVFDGHGGDEVALHAQKKFGPFLRARLAEYCTNGLSEVAVWNALKISFVDTSRSILSEAAGSTAAVCLKIGQKLFAANAGDSRLMLITPDGSPILLSEDATLDLAHMARRVEKRGAIIVRGEAQQLVVVPEIEGGVTVNNAGGIAENCFGNSARPKIVSYLLPDDPTGYMLLIGSDGLWDVTTADDVAACVHSIRQDEPKIISAAVVARAYNASDHDNISVVIAKF